VPALLATAADATVLLPQLLDRDWALFGEQPPTAAAGVLFLGPEWLQLMVDGQALLDDVNPAAPERLVGRRRRPGDRCVVVVTHETDVDLAHHDSGAQLVALLGIGRAVLAALPVVTDLTG
jgi:hypothetical protein